MNIKLKLSMMLLTATMALSNCTSTTDNLMSDLEPIETQYFHPPTWIQGKWQNSGTSYYKFTNDDFLIIAGNNETSFKTILNQSSTLNNVAKVDETISETVYNFVIKSGTQTHAYQFKKINATTIQWVNSSTPSAFYLTKQ